MVGFVEVVAGFWDCVEGVVVFLMGVVESWWWLRRGLICLWFPVIRFLVLLGYWLGDGFFRVVGLRLGLLVLMAYLEVGFAGFMGTR